MKTFAANTFAAKTFACRTLRGLGLSILGPWKVVAAGVHHAGSDMSEVFHPGAAASGVYNAGSERGDVWPK